MNMNEVGNKLAG